MSVTAQSLTRSMRGHWHGSYGMVRCPVHKDKNPSCKVSNPLGSTMKDRPVFHCFAGCDWRDVVAELESCGLLPKWEATKQGGHSKSHRSTQKKSLDIQKPADLNDPDVVRKRQLAWKIWQETTSIENTLGHEYLLNRGITLTPHSVRFHPSLRHPDGFYWPAVIIAYQRLDCSFDGVQRIYLDPQTALKAPLENAKLSLGTSLGSAMRFGDVQSQKEMVNCGFEELEADVFGELGLAEGPEDAMSAVQMYGINVWAAGGGNRMKQMELPQPLSGLWIYSDNDATGARFAKETIERHFYKVLQFRTYPDRYGIVTPDPCFKDFNEMLQAIGI